MLGGMAGVLIALYSNAVFPHMGQPMLHKGIAVVILGGMGDIRGALLGGFFLGFAEVFSVAYIGSTMRDAVAFGLLFTILVVAPAKVYSAKRRSGARDRTSVLIFQAGVGQEFFMEWLDTFWATYSTLVLTVGTNILLALSIYLTLACGLLTVANAAFMGIGAYTAALLTLHRRLPFLLALTGWRIAAGAVALVIGQPTLRLSGVYLAMATLAFGEVVRICDSQRRGDHRRRARTQWHSATHERPRRALAVGAALYVLLRLARSRIGRTMIAISQDEVATELMGHQCPRL